MSVISQSARIEGTAPFKEMAAFLDTASECAGYAVGVNYWPKWHYVVLAEREGRTALIALPSERWVQDLKDDGWRVIQVLSEATEAPSPDVPRSDAGVFE